jgi:hypothetical protein
VPSNLKYGNYILYVYLQYPYGITGVFSNAATVIGLNNNNYDNSSLITEDRQNNLIAVIKKTAEMA